jgi:hypothetical protein
MTRPTIISLVGVYHADGSLTGELRYWVGARLGRAHCALCDITHGHFAEKREWQRCRESLPVPFAAVHLDERDPDLLAFTGTATPSVVARTDQGLRPLLGPADLERLDGDPEALVAALLAAVDAAGLSWA